jgi:hypothetical protein
VYCSGSQQKNCKPYAEVDLKTVKVPTARDADARCLFDEPDGEPSERDNANSLFPRVIMTNDYERGEMCGEVCQYRNNTVINTGDTENLEDFFQFVSFYSLFSTG